jgi:AbrB family looped-hinge helix DNA binding protein
MIRTIKVTDKGQIAIPKLIREELGIYKGDELIVLSSGGKLILQKAEKVSEKMEEDFKDIQKLGLSVLHKIWDNKEDEIWNEYLK